MKNLEITIQDKILLLTINRVDKLNSLNINLLEELDNVFSSYTDNTIFLFFGDHGTSDPRANHMPPSDFELKLKGKLECTC